MQNAMNILGLAGKTFFPEWVPDTKFAQDKLTQAVDRDSIRYSMKTGWSCIMVMAAISAGKSGIKIINFKTRMFLSWKKLHGEF